MSELISGKEAWIAKTDKKDVQYSLGGMDWCELTDKEFYCWSSDRFLNESLNYKFRIKPRTITLNGIEVGLLVSSKWISAKSNKVELEFNSKEEAHYFYTKAMEIFKTKKGSEND